MPQNAVFHLGLHCLRKKILRQIIQYFFLKLQPNTPRYVQWTIPRLLYQTRRKNPLVHKGLNPYIDISSGDRGLILGPSLQLLCFVDAHMGRLT